MGQIEEIEETIRSKNKARERGKEGEEGKAAGDKDADGGAGGKATGVGEEDDDYYDRYEQGCSSFVAACRTLLTLLW